MGATSSKELRKREEGEKKARAARRKTKRKSTHGKKKGTKAALTQRLQEATARAKAAVVEADYSSKKQQLQETTTKVSRPPFALKNDTEHPVMGTLSQLTKIIDKELRSASDGTATFNVHGTTNPPPGITRDSMRSLLEENDSQSTRLERKSNSSDSVRHISVVISKPLVQDQVTLEYACRLRALARAIQSNGMDNNNMSNGNDEDEPQNTVNSKPSILCFLGGISQGNLVSDADAGYIYFNHLCAANHISLGGIDIMLERTTLGKGAMKHVVRHLRKEYIREWFNEVPSGHKVQLHFTFFSCDYDLCRLNDIHSRSPIQSVLSPLVEGEGQSDDRVHTTWSYSYCTYPYVHFKDKITAFLGKCYLLAQELTPVLVNIRGVVDGVSASKTIGRHSSCFVVSRHIYNAQTEFFQRDNYRVLVSIRRSFVSDMERFYESEPSLKNTLRQYVSNSDYPLDIVLEGALLSMGRCLDLVRPAGLLIGYVPNTDWKNAEMVLEHAVRQLRDACDPDHPLDPADWGKLDHHYDQPHEQPVADVASLNSWRLEEEVDDDEGQLE